MNITVWIVASVMSLLILASGAVKVARPRQTLVDGGYTWAEDFSDATVKAIGLLEVLGAAGLVLPGLLGVAPVLVPTAATCLTVLLLAAALTHLRRGEARQAAVPLVLAAATAFVAVLRFSGL